ncbi:MAG: Stage II sporulation protein R [Thermoanaerobacterales bacterium 50_218]|nr:MAG: Stage II sporulation protein R [Thermoanaerobacterales bacterium 50_218]HAA89762.1 stage II sporulation protein R [Peptococcaceae bacterium]
MKKITVVLLVFLMGMGILTSLVLGAVSRSGASLAGINWMNNQEVIRFHVIAKDDSEEQQELKLRVRDAVLTYLKPQLKKAADREEASEFIENHLSEIREVAAETVSSEGYSEKVGVVWGLLPFPAKSYGPYVFSAGTYQALEVVIGEGAGKNWWCVLFPPLCYLDFGEAMTSEQGGTASKRIPEEREIVWRIQEIIERERPHSLFTWIWKRKPHS